MEVGWLRSQNSEVVHLYRDGQDQYGEQMLEYRGRTELLKDDITNGRVSLRIRDIRPSDDGQYSCYFQSSASYKDALLELEVTDLGSAPVISVEGHQDGGIQVVCQSSGWYPEPKAQWRDHQGQLLPSASEEITPEANGLFQTEIAIVLTEESNQKVSCCVRNPRLNQERESAISIAETLRSDKESEKESLRSEMERQTEALQSEMERQKEALQSEMERQKEALRSEMERQKEATLVSQFSLLSPAEQLRRLRKRPRQSKEDLLHEVMQQTVAENRKMQEWCDSKMREWKENTEQLLNIMELQADSMQQLIPLVLSLEKQLMTLSWESVVLRPSYDDGEGSLVLSQLHSELRSARLHHSLPRSTGSQAGVSMSAENMEVGWLRSQDSEVVHLYHDGQDQYGQQMPEYSGRTELLRDDITNGRVFLRIHDIQPSDNGPYKCFFQSSVFYKDSLLELQVAGLGSDPVISVEGHQDGGIRVVCRSDRWYSQPEAQWRDLQGQILPSASENIAQEANGLFQAEIAIVITEESNQKVSCCVRNPLLNQERKTAISLAETLQLDKESEKEMASSGSTLTSGNSKKINFESLKELIWDYPMEEVPKEIMVEQTGIVRIMEHAEKMYLVPSHYLEQIKCASSGEENIRTTTTHQLDSEMKDILQRTGLSDYEKAKLYEGVLQRYLVLAKHGETEKTKINLFFPEQEQEQEELQPPEVQGGVHRTLSFRRCWRG
ncbi:hypothetical protein KIL84_004325 [Mauremys mutica]|uniref:Ig-like domain-containing protein n=1 Tax=Mauremys mutica TaxID=74926 RepID=A0A9D4B672_9SAUR|nr:hypothetical protein KIL84_004325 [Mauremys mutica]